MTESPTEGAVPVGMVLVPREPTEAIANMIMQCTGCELAMARNAWFATQVCLPTASTEATPAHPATDEVRAPAFRLGDRVEKTKGAAWRGIVVGTYSTSLTAEGYAVESEREPGSVQIYPVAALRLVSREALAASGGEGVKAFDINGELETDEPQPRAVTKDEFDFPSGNGSYMGTFARRDQTQFRDDVGLWDADGMSRNWPAVPNLRNVEQPS